MPKKICSVPAEWTLADAAAHSCGDGSHRHLSLSELRDIEKRSVVVWLHVSRNRREKSIVQVMALEERDDRWAGKPSASKSPGGALNAGLSFRVGAYLAKRVRQQQGWALVMLAEIRRPEAERLGNEF